MKYSLFLFAAWALCSPAIAADAPPVVTLWPNGAPGSEGKTAPEKVRVTDQGDHVYSNINHPNITVYLPASDQATGAGVLVIPGGGHSEIWADHEGFNVAQWLASHGIAAFVLKYRLAKEPGSTYTVEKDELADTQRALRVVRAHAAEWGVDPARVGVIGFSAGGELAALVSMRNDNGQADATDPVERQGCKPAFQGLMYPGNSASIQPTKDSPPAFLCCGEQDRTDISEGLANVYLLFKRAGVPADLHIYAGVGHGFGLRPTTKGAVADWPQRFADWLRDRGFLRKKS
ncbi:MAG TPA: alpha/beta hydrolase [Opitutales bacterium]|nr:alpha/beta hydrolase [Opitutales bacterium]